MGLRKANMVHYNYMVKVFEYAEELYLLVASSEKLLISA